VNSESGTPSQSESETRPCPHCTETISVAANKCDYCGESLAQGVRVKKTSGVGIAAGIAAILLAIGGALLGPLAVLLLPAALVCCFVAFVQAQRGIGSIGVGLIIVGAASLWHGYEVTKYAGPFSTPAVTKAGYDQIQQGMTYAQVRAVIGGAAGIMTSGHFDESRRPPWQDEPVVIVDAEGRPTTVSVYQWHNPDSWMRPSWMRAEFHDGRLFSKDDYGLR
jgi:hypothetical protein